MSDVASPSIVVDHVRHAVSLVAQAAGVPRSDVRLEIFFSPETLALVAREFPGMLASDRFWLWPVTYPERSTTVRDVEVVAIAGAAGLESRFVSCFDLDYEPDRFI